MTYRDDLPYITISLGLFQKFDRGEEIRERIDEKFNLQPGEVFSWECAQFDGAAEVISREGKWCTIVKKS